jgi:Cu(I)/Ag(I) efflux system membrane protein CusA/SilA
MIGKDVSGRLAERLKLVVQVTLFLICLFLYINTGSISKTMIVLLAVPFSAVGAQSGFCIWPATT